ncbi:hypothetical protein E1A91_D02G070000v1 [Gossypium mustelinum]|uniref:Uncharacterized protein n=1 Tax=Gossypium mustelinum TaxID=34275 RepID=A0A5D2VT51_GOSMU|nr:hypothetical protein E1A91_D02G070000v1 [Gossypium mustelinum]
MGTSRATRICRFSTSMRTSTKRRKGRGSVENKAKVNTASKSDESLAKMTSTFSDSDTTDPEAAK